MAHGYSLELAEIKAPEWRPVDPAKLAESRVARKRKKLLSKKIRNRIWKSAVWAKDKQGKLAGCITNPIRRGEFMARLRERFNV